MIDSPPLRDLRLYPRHAPCAGPADCRADRAQAHRLLPRARLSSNRREYECDPGAAGRRTTVGRRARSDSCATHSQRAGGGQRHDRRSVSGPEMIGLARHPLPRRAERIGRYHSGLRRRPGLFDSHRPIPSPPYRNGRRCHKPRRDCRSQSHEAGGSQDLPGVAGEIITISEPNTVRLQDPTHFQGTGPSPYERRLTWKNSNRSRVRPLQVSSTLNKHL